MRRKAGFTLIELLVVLVIIGLVSSVATFAIGRIERQRDADVAARFTAWLVAARDRAQFDGGIYALDVSTAGAQLRFWLDNRWVAVADGSWSATDGVSLSGSADPERPRVLFLPDGTLSDDGGIELLRDRRAVHTVTWQRDGSIAWEQDDG